jgi:tRNA G10  N-methylase Trm11
MQTFAILGSHPHISKAEFLAVTDAKLVTSSPDVAIFEGVDQEITHLQQRLGGVQKLGSIIGSFTKHSIEDIAEFLSSLLIADANEGRISYGISIYDLGDTQQFGNLKKIHHAIGMEVKKKVKGFGHKARFVTGRDPALSSVIVTKGHLLQDGAEFCLFATPKGIVVGQTACVQDFEDWSYRDFDRPARDAVRGMLPPKLARIMVNLSGKDPESSRLLDPFCGSGTVLMEALQVGFGRVTGSDIAQRAVEDTKSNLDWLESGETTPAIDLHISKAGNLHAVLEKESIDVVVTEPFLGRPRQGREGRDEINRSIDALVDMYRESFASIKHILAPGATIVIASPIHMLRDESFPVPTRKIMKGLGFTEHRFKDTLLYRQKGQYVARELMRFTV